MGDKSKIDWTDATWNPIVGCSIVSPACTNCYAMAQAQRIRSMSDALGRPSHYDDVVRYSESAEHLGRPVWTGKIGHAPDSILFQPLAWAKPRRIFVNSMSDLFHDGVEDWKIAQVYGIMIAAHHLRGHTLQWLTKRPARARKLLNDTGFWDEVNATAEQEVMDRCDPLNRKRNDARATLDDYSPANPPPGIWAGVTAEDQARADERVPDLLAAPASKRFVSAEPLLGSIDWKRWLPTKRPAKRPDGTPFLAPHFYMTRCEHCGWVGSSELCGIDSFGDDSDVFCPSCHRSIRADDMPNLDWVIAGGESGPRARPSHPDWVRSLRDQCAAAGVPFFFKQWGEWGEPTDSLGKLDWPYHKDHDRTHWFDARTCVRPAEAGWSDKYHHGHCRALDPGVNLFETPEYLDQVARCPQASCRTAGKCQGNEGRAAVTRVGKRRAGHLLDGREHRELPA